MGEEEGGNLSTRRKLPTPSPATCIWVSHTDRVSRDEIWIQGLSLHWWLHSQSRLISLLSLGTPWTYKGRGDTTSRVVDVTELKLSYRRLLRIFMPSLVTTSSFALAGNFTTNKVECSLLTMFQQPFKVIKHICCSLNTSRQVLIKHRKRSTNPLGSKVTCTHRR